MEYFPIESNVQIENPLQKKKRTRFLEHVEMFKSINSYQIKQAHFDKLECVYASMQ